MQSQSHFRQELRKLGRKVMAELAAGKWKRVFVLLGKDYNLGDPRLNCEIADLFAARGEVVLTQHAGR